MTSPEFAGLRKLHGNPLQTNASLNRTQAMRMFEAGMRPADIAREFPKVFTETDSKLGQVYDSYYPDGRKETKYTVLQSAVDKAIRKYVKARKATR